LHFFSDFAFLADGEGFGNGLESQEQAADMYQQGSKVFRGSFETGYFVCEKFHLNLNGDGNKERTVAPTKE